MGDLHRIANRDPTRVEIIILTMRPFFALFCLCVAALAQNTKSADVFFLQMSDPQFGMYTNNGDFAQETANFELAIATGNRLHPAFVVVCGDLVNKPGDPKQIAEYQRISRRLDPGIKLYSVPGNHDVENSPTRDSLAAYRKAMGADYYAFRSRPILGIVLNSSIIQHPDLVPEEAAKQEAWLKEELHKASSGGAPWILIFQHIPWFLKTADEPDQYFNIPRETRARYIDLFTRSGVQYVFAGHLHENSYGETGSLHMITTGPVGKPLGQASSGIRVVEVRGGGLREHYYSLGNLPNQIPNTATQK